MKGRQVIVQRGRRAPEPKGEPRNLPAASIEDIARQTYVTPNEARIYLRFDTLNAFYKWATKNSIPRAHRGRRLLFLRRDLDRLVHGTAQTADLIAERFQPQLARHRRTS